MTLSVHDRFAIQDLYARYNHAIDLGDPEGWAACFTADARFTTSRTGTIRGREGLVDFARSFNARMKSRHWTNNLVLEGTELGAVGSCYLILLTFGPDDKASLAMTGLYRDDIVRHEGGWAFASRDVTIDG